MDLKDKDYSESDLEASLKRAFVEERADFIFIDGHSYRNSFLTDGVNFGIERGWLYFDREGGDSQWTTWEYRLTEDGKRYFGVKE